MAKRTAKKKQATSATAAATAAPVVPIAKFNPAGGSVLARISSGFAQPGSYELLLWEAGENKIIMEKRGNFLNSEDDEYPLPGPNGDHDNRYVQALVTVAITPPVLNYAVALTVSQDGQTLATDLKASAGLAGEAVTRTLWVRLEAQ